MDVRNSIQEVSVVSFFRMVFTGNMKWDPCLGGRKQAGNLWWFGMICFYLWYKSIVIDFEWFAPRGNFEWFAWNNSLGWCHIMTPVFCCVADGFFHWRKQKQTLKDSDSNIQDTGTHISSYPTFLEVSQRVAETQKGKEKVVFHVPSWFSGANLPLCEFGKCVLVSPNEKWAIYPPKV